MVLTKKQVQQRIDQLIEQDDKSKNIISGYYQEALMDIRNNLNAFYVHYASETGLTLKQVKQRVSSWDIQQFKQAVQQVNDVVDQTDDKEIVKQAKQRIKRAKATATISKKDLLLSIIGLSIVTMAVKTHHRAGQQIKEDVIEEARFRGIPEMQIEGAISHSLTLSTRLSESIWNGADGLQSVVNYLIQQNLSGEGLTPSDLAKLFPYMNDPKGLSKTSASKYFNQLFNNSIRLIRTESAGAVDEIVMNDFKRRKVKLIEWICEPGACSRCIAIQEDGPYTLKDCPSIPVHANCRCSKREYVE